MSRGLKNNNPGNIRISATKYEGEIQPSQDKAFKQFAEMRYGYRAMFVLLYTYQKKHNLNTIRAMINRYAPPADNNDTSRYVQIVSNSAGIYADDKIDTKDRAAMTKIVSAMSFVENGVQANDCDVQRGFDLFEEYLK
jgi:hypothetical protein